MPEIGIIPALGMLASLGSGVAGIVSASKAAGNAENLQKSGAKERQDLVNGLNQGPGASSVGIGGVGASGTPGVGIGGMTPVGIGGTGMSPSSSSLLKGPGFGMNGSLGKLSQG